MEKKGIKAKQDESRKILHCIDCQIATDYHELAADGSFIFCRCKYFKFSRLLKYDSCDKIIAKKDGLI